MFASWAWHMQASSSLRMQASSVQQMQFSLPCQGGQAQLADVRGKTNILIWASLNTHTKWLNTEPGQGCAVSFIVMQVELLEQPNRYKHKPIGAQTRTKVRSAKCQWVNQHCSDQRCAFACEASNWWLMTLCVRTLALCKATTSCTSGRWTCGRPNYPCRSLCIHSQVHCTCNDSSHSHVYAYALPCFLAKLYRSRSQV